MEQSLDGDGGEVRMPSAAAASHEAEKAGEAERPADRPRVVEGYVDPGEADEHMD